MKYTKSMAARRAQSEGAAFENIFQSSALRQDIICTRIPDGCKQLPNKRIIRVKSPFDWVLSYGGKAALIDTKSVDATTFKHSLIDLFQATTLLRHELKGTPAGYVVWLRKIDEVIFIPASTLTRALQTTGSIGITGATQLGGMQTMDIKKVFVAPAPHNSLAE